ncbi:VOC family protein [uncultured Caulobacter sp.]|uniref:VOC family protein n=1 Tax=uncultured Caulobacter sp. TaxID=158749 RepID=UPI00262536DE|nr:VOC family protein [uncultured Caulobacter sp.]
MSANTLQITPFMHVAEMEPALAFLTEILGFTVFVNGGGYAYLEREGAGLRVLANSDPAERGRPHGGFAYYIDVRSLDTVLEQLGSKLEQLPAGAVHGPVDQPYGQRELMIRAPDGNLIVFGQAIASPT